MNTEIAWVTPLTPSWWLVLQHLTATGQPPTPLALALLPWRELRSHRFVLGSQGEVPLWNGNQGPHCTPEYVQVSGSQRAKLGQSHPQFLCQRDSESLSWVFPLKMHIPNLTTKRHQTLKLKGILDNK